MELYYNGVKLTQLNVVAATTVKEIKKYLHDWLVPQGITSYNIRIVLNNGTIIPETVFQSDLYDNVNFQAQIHLLSGGYIRVDTDQTVTTSQTVTTTQPDYFQFQRMDRNLKWKTMEMMDSRSLINLCYASQTMLDFCKTRDWFWKNRVEKEFTFMNTPTLTKIYNTKGSWFEVYVTMEDELAKLTTRKLKELLRNKKLKVSGVKADLISRILGRPVRKVVNTAPTPGVHLFPLFDGLLTFISSYSVIVKFQKKGDNIDYSIGRMSSGGTYKPDYITNSGAVKFLQDNLMNPLIVLFNRFRELHPRKRTLYFRYNQRRNILETFTSSGMNLDSKVDILDK